MNSDTPKEKPHLILLHGALGSESQLLKLKQIAENNFAVHTLNFSGHGGTETPEQGFSLELFEKNLRDFMSSKQIYKAHLFGYSMGGFIAVSFAGKYPEAVSSVITLATKYDWTPETASREAAMLRPEIMQQKIPAFVAGLEELHRPTDWKKIVSATADFMMHLGTHPLNVENYQRVTCPVLCAVGEKDKMVSIGETEKTASLIPNGTSIILKDTPHPLEACDFNLLYNKITEFILQKNASQ